MHNSNRNIPNVVYKSPKKPRVHNILFSFEATAIHRQGTFLIPPCLSDFPAGPGVLACGLELDPSDPPVEVWALQAAMPVAALLLEVDFPVPWEGAWAVFLVGTRLVVPLEMQLVPALLEMKGASSPGTRR